MRTAKPEPRPAAPTTPAEDRRSMRSDLLGAARRLGSAQSTARRRGDHGNAEEIGRIRKTVTRIAEGLRKDRT